MTQGWTKGLWFVGAALLGGGCDLQTKSWAVEHLGDLPGNSMAILQPWVEFSLSYNYGTAFSFIRDLGTARIVFGVLSLLTVGFLFILTLRSEQRKLQAAAFGLVAGGAIGNGVQRLTGNGVVDFIKVNYPWGGSWPTFNIADVLVVLGVALLFLEEWRHRPSASSQASEPSAPA